MNSPQSRPVSGSGTPSPARQFAPPGSSPETAPPVLLGVVIVTLLALWQVATAGLNQDARNSLGALRVTGEAGWAPSAVWLHRPLEMRWLLTGLSVVSPGPHRLSEALLRGWCCLLAAGAAYLLWRGLRRRVEGASLIALAVGAALVVAPGWDFAEPEWFAGVFSVAAIGCALALPRWPGALCGGTLCALATFAKYTTLTTALIGLGVLFVVDRGRAWRTALVSVPAGAVLFAGTLLIEPREWQWLLDMRTLNPPPNSGLLSDAAEGLVNSALVSPITLVAVGCAALLLLRSPRYRFAVGWWAAGSAVAVLPYLVQHQNFLYHLAALPVLAAGFVAWASTRPELGADPVPPLLAVVATLLGALAFLAGAKTRNHGWILAGLAAGLLVLLAVVAAVLVERRRQRSQNPSSHRSNPRAGWARALTLVTALAPFLVAVSPLTAYSYSLAHASVTSQANLRAGHEVGVPGLGRDVPVQYFAFSTPYLLGNPSPCRYATPTFLQRAKGVRAASIGRTRSFADNLACLSDRRNSAAVVERSWFDPHIADPRVREEFFRNYACPQTDAPVLVCPRRLSN